MKRISFFVMAGLTLLIFAASCSKSNTSASTSLEGKWTGNYHGGPGPVNYYSLTFKSGGSLLVQSDNSTTPNSANGTWTLSGDSVRATYTFVTSSLTYSIAGKYSASSNTMDGTIGNGLNTSGVFVFNVVKE